MKQVYQYIAIFLNLLTTSNHLHPLQVENCESNSRLVVDVCDVDVDQHEPNPNPPAPPPPPRNGGKGRC